MITPQQFRNQQVKPKWQLPMGVIESVVAFNCRKYGMPRPVLAMPMWENAGNRALDYSGHGNHGTLNGPGWVAGGLDFNGSTDYVNLGSVDINIGSNFTIVCRVKAPQDRSSHHVIIAKGPKDAGHFEVYFRQLTGVLSFYAHDLSNGGGDSDKTIDDDTWHQFVITYNGSNLLYYIDGILGTNIECTGTIADETETFRVGGLIDGTLDYIGIINDSAIYPATITAAQVKFLYENPYFMYQIPEKLYGYVTSAPPVIFIPRIIMF